MSHWKIRQTTEYFFSMSTFSKCTTLVHMAIKTRTWSCSCPSSCTSLMVFLRYNLINKNDDTVLVCEMLTFAAILFVSKRVFFCIHFEHEQWSDHWLSRSHVFVFSCRDWDSGSGRPRSAAPWWREACNCWIAMATASRTTPNATTTTPSCRWTGCGNAACSVTSCCTWPTRRSRLTKWCLRPAAPTSTPCLLVGDLTVYTTSSNAEKCENYLK